MSGVCDQLEVINTAMSDQNADQTQPVQYGSIQSSGQSGVSLNNS